MMMIMFLAIIDDDTKVRSDLVTVAAPGLSVERGEQSPVLGALPRPHLKIMMIMMTNVTITPHLPAHGE